MSDGGKKALSGDSSLAHSNDSPYPTARALSRVSGIAGLCLCPRKGTSVSCDAGTTGREAVASGRAAGDTLGEK